MSVSDGHMGIESQRLPGQAMTGIGPDVVQARPGQMDDVCCIMYCFTLAMCTPSHGCGVGRRDRWLSRCLDLPCLEPWSPGESFSGLGAMARESVGQLLPNATPQSSAWRSHLARKPWTLGAASLKARCYDTAMQRPSEQDSGATLLLRTSWQSRCRVMVVTSFIERQ